MIAAADMARRSYAFEPAYRNLRLNQRIRTDVDARLVDAATWNRGAVPVIESNLVGKHCTCGFDFAAKHDLWPSSWPSPVRVGFSISCVVLDPVGAIAGETARRARTIRAVDTRWVSDRRPGRHRRPRMGAARDIGSGVTISDQGNPLRQILHGRGSSLR